MCKCISGIAQIPVKHELKRITFYTLLLRMESFIKPSIHIRVESMQKAYRFQTFQCVCNRSTGLSFVHCSCVVRIQCIIYTLKTLSHIPFHLGLLNCLFVFVFVVAFSS